MNSAKRPILFAFITLFFVILSLNCSAQNSTAAPSPAARPAFRMPNTIVSPEILPDNKVTFRIMAPKASEISLNGDWMSGFGTVQPLIKSDTGLWMITVGPLKPEIYGYSFIIDGVSTIDPNNIQIRRDGKNYQSFFIIPGKESDLYVDKDIPHGTLSILWYESPTLGPKRRMYVYTPAGYDKSTDKYPVFYLLHGGGGDEDAWVTMGRACEIMDNLIIQGKAMPMIVVMTNGAPEQVAAPTVAPQTDNSKPSSVIGDGKFKVGMGNGKFEESLINDVLPYIEDHYRVLTDQSKRAVAGLSMGGLQTQKLALKYPNKFGYFGVWSMGVYLQPDPFNSIDTKALVKSYDDNIDALKNGGYKLYWIGCGKDDVIAYEIAFNLRNILDKHDFKYIYRESTGGHTWTNWRMYLSEFAPLLFK